jgi:menaquinone-dependent protoporphyrinogen IX oxidase
MSKNNNIVVIYQSMTGFTKNYATWLAEELHCDLREGNKVSVKDLKAYDTIIYGGGMYHIGIKGVKLITKNYDKLKDKKLIVFAVGATPVRAETTEYIRQTNIPAEQYDRIQFFYLRGGFNYNKLSPFYKLLMILLKIKLKHVKNPDADQKGMLASYTHPLDLINKKNLLPILESVGMNQ